MESLAINKRLQVRRLQLAARPARAGRTFSSSEHLAAVGADACARSHLGNHAREVRERHRALRTWAAHRGTVGACSEVLVRTHGYHLSEVPSGAGGQRGCR